MIIWNLPKTELITLREIDEKRAVTVVFSGPAWGLVKDRLRLNMVSQVEVKTATEDSWNGLLNTVLGEAIYAIGGGLPADASKYFSAKTGIPLTCIPTALSVDAFFTWASGIRRNGNVVYIETKTPDSVVIDLDVVAAAPASIRAAGICDVMSIATGNWDWEYAGKLGLNPPTMTYQPEIARIAKDLLISALDCADAAGKGDREGLKQLLDCLALEVQLCNQVGHARPEEGSEHYFAYCVENETGPGYPHADLLGPGILLMSSLQQQQVAPLERALQAAHIPLDRIPVTSIRKTLITLPQFCQRHNLPHGLAHDLTPSQIDQLDIDSLLRD